MNPRPADQQPSEQEAGLQLREEKIRQRELELMRLLYTILRRENAALPSQASTTSRSTINVKKVSELLDEYSGSGESFALWKTRVNLLQNIYEFDDDAARIMVESKLRGEAFSWYHSKVEHSTMSVEELLNQMGSIFDRRLGSVELRKRFEARIWQRNESFSDYCNSKIILGNQVPVSDEEILYYVINGIPSESLKNQARMQSFSSIQDLLQAFKNIELNAQPKDTKHNNKPWSHKAEEPTEAYDKQKIGFTDLRSEVRDELEELDRMKPEKVSSPQSKGAIKKAGSGGITYQQILDKIVEKPGQGLKYITQLTENLEIFRETNEGEIEIWEEHLTTLTSMPPNSLSGIIARLGRHRPLTKETLSAFLDGACSGYTTNIAEQSAEMFKQLTKISEFSSAQMEIMKKDMDVEKKESSALLVQLRAAAEVASSFKSDVEKVALKLTKLDITPPINTTRTQNSEGPATKVKTIKGDGIFKCDGEMIQLSGGVPIAVKNCSETFEQLYKFASRHKKSGVACIIFNRDIRSMLLKIAANRDLWAEFICETTSKDRKRQIYSKLIGAVPFKEWQWYKLNDSESKNLA